MLRRFKEDLYRFRAGKDLAELQKQNGEMTKVLIERKGA